MLNSHKVSFSLPKKDFEQMEKVRKRMGLGRSTIIDMAIRFWLNQLKEKELIRQYIEAYKKFPEKTQGLNALEKAGLETFNPGEEW